MNEVLITARTRMRDGQIAVAGLDLLSGKLIRLTDRRGFNLTEIAPYQPGELWNLSYVPKHDLQRPHVEDVSVVLARRVATTTNVRSLLEEFPVAVQGSPRRLFNGRLTFGAHPLGTSSSLPPTPFLSRHTPTPERSLELWWTDRALTRNIQRRDDKESIYLIGPSPSPEETAIKALYAGFDDPGLIVPAGSLVSLSLARWSNPEGSDRRWERCYLQVCNVLWAPVGENRPVSRAEHSIAI